MSDIQNATAEFYISVTPQKAMEAFTGIISQETLFLGYLAPYIIDGGELKKEAIIEAIGEDAPGGGVPIRGKINGHYPYGKEHPDIGALKFEFEDLAFYDAYKNPYYFKGVKTKFHLSVEKSGSGNPNESFIIVGVSFIPVRAGLFSKIRPSKVIPFVIRYLEYNLK